MSNQRIAVINDTHFGSRAGSEVFLNNAERFFTETFFPYCKENDIKTVLHLGDFFDNRKVVGIKTLNAVKRFFINPIVENDMRVKLILGNHDVAYKNTNDLNSPQELLSEIPNFRIITEPEIIRFYNLPVAFVPWINAENSKDILKFIRKADAPWLVGHFDISGFQMAKGATVESGGLNQSIFKKYERVLSGHFHTKSSNGNIDYLGTQYELTWADCDDPKHFHVIDCADREIISVKNPQRLYFKFFYDDGEYENEDDLHRLDFSYVRGCFVKIIVSRKEKNPFWLDIFYEKIRSSAPYDIKMIDAKLVNELTDEEDDNLSLMDPLTFVSKQIDASETKLNKSVLKSLMSELYNEALDNDSF